MVEKISTKVILFMTVLLPFIALVACTIAIFPDLPDELGIGLPRVFIFFPAFVCAILPATYGVMVFRFSEHLKRIHYLGLAVCMDIGILSLIGAIYLVKDSA